ncbi:F-box protein PP2-B10-like [Momordica charantia]|uniref:F-box protein PP2-B10-like n=1 Tax=Momordica charantia TaxID=3673 RepID=A0A6J1D065_MOMCH|nr:F-box protein PP2-B10-like [Momordica charantia]
MVGDWFSEVAKLDHVWWLDIKGKIESRKLSPKTNYAAHLVFKLAENGRHWHGLRRRPVLLRVYFEGAEVEEGNMVVLDPPEGAPTDFHERADGWMEIKMGEILTNSEMMAPLFSVLMRSITIASKVD